MRPLSEEQIRGSFVNLDPEQAQRVPLPGLHEVIWEQREYLGWRDRQAHQRGYLVHEDGDGAVAIVLRASEFSLNPGIAAMCSLCHSTQPSSQVSLFTAPRAGRAGLEGSTVGTYICDDLACSHLIRMLPATSPMNPAPGDLLERRAENLLRRVRAFTSSVTA